MQASPTRPDQAPGRPSSSSPPRSPSAISSSSASRRRAPGSFMIRSQPMAPYRVRRQRQEHVSDHEGNMEEKLNESVTRVDAQIAIQPRLTITAATIASAY